MSDKRASNGGFRWQEISRANFQRTTAEILGSQKHEIDGLTAKLRAQGEFMADMSLRLDEHQQQIATHRAAFTAWGIRDLMARLRWLFAGK